MPQTHKKPRPKRSGSPAARSAAPRPGAVVVSAALIVKDEAPIINRCLDSVRPLVDEIVVYDTGSSDDTVALCRAAGARVIEGYWDEDFSRARNAVLAECRGEWVLSIDADETADGSRPGLRSALGNAARANIGLLFIDQTIMEPEGAASYQVHQQRLFRRQGARWAGRVHEQPVARPGLRSGELDSDVLRLKHFGYGASAERNAAKSERNLALALADVTERAQGDDADSLAKALLDLGRSLMGVNRWSDAFTAFADVRNLVHDGWLWAEATSCLARIAVITENYVAAIDLAEELSTSDDTLTGYAHYVATQALVGVGQIEAARELIATVDEVVDPTGRRYDPGHVHQFKAMLGAA